jgi:hypothetical protein
MATTALISARVTVDMKQRFAAVARQQEQSESVLLKRLVDAALMTAAVAKPEVIQHVEHVAATGKVSVRLRLDDLLLLRERATARALPMGTYVSLLVRSHLRTLTPIPTAELVALKCSVAEISAIGRNLNQIARALNQGQRTSGPSAADLYALLRALEGLRIHIKGIINANLTSWRTGHEKTSHCS